MKTLANRALGRIVGMLAGAMIVSGCGGVDVTANSSSANATALIALDSSSYTAVPASELIVTISRAGSSAGSATVSYTTVNGSATAGADYVATSGSVTWQDGDTTAKTVSVPVTAQAGGKQFAFALTGIEGQASLGSPASASVGVNAAPSSAPGSVTLSWAAPTENTNGSALTDLAGFDIYYGTSATAMTQRISVNSVGNLTYMIENLTAGTWYFEVYAINAAGVQSGPSSTVSTTI